MTTVSRHATPALARTDRGEVGGLLQTVAAALMVLGAVMAFSTSARLDRPVWPQNPLESPAVRQALFVLLGLLAMGSTAALGHRHLRWQTREHGRRRPFWRQPALWVLAIATAALLVALVPGLGSERQGARRWLHFGPASLGIGFQPSELAKLAVIVFLAAWLPARSAVMGELRRGTLTAAALVGAFAGLIVIEDLGTAALISLVGGTMILAAGARLRHAVLLALPGVVLFAMMIWVTPYRLKRLTSFMNIWDDPMGAGYHPIQSLVAIASGGWWGCGLGAGLQKYGYLPEARNDFVFAVVCEELGLVGGLTVLAMFVCLVVLGIVITRRTPDPFGKLLALGITLMIGVQAAMNIAVVTVSVPTKGISLPLVSSGGSGVVFYSVAVGLLVSVGRVASSAGARRHHETP